MSRPRPLVDLIPQLGEESPLRAAPPLDGELVLPVSRAKRETPARLRRTADAALFAALGRGGAEEAPLEARLAEAEERGRAAAEREAADREADLLERAREEADARLAEARAEWTASEGARLAAALDAAVRELADGVAGTTARVLAPFLDKVVLERAIADLADTVIETAACCDPPVLRLSGPPDLLEAVAAALGPGAPALELAPSEEEVELRLVADFTVFETRIAAWRARLRAALEAPAGAAPANDAASARAFPEAAATTAATDADALAGGSAVAPEGADGEAEGADG